MWGWIKGRYEVRGPNDTYIGSYSNQEVIYDTAVRYGWSGCYSIYDRKIERLYLMYCTPIRTKIKVIDSSTGDCIKEDIVERSFE